MVIYFRIGRVLITKTNVLLQLHMEDHVIEKNIAALIESVCTQRPVTKALGECSLHSKYTWLLLEFLQNKTKNPSCCCQSILFN